MLTKIVDRIRKRKVLRLAMELGCDFDGDLGESIVWAIKRDLKDALAVEKRTSFRKGLFAGAIVATCVPIVCVVKERIMSKKEKSTK